MKRRNIIRPKIFYLCGGIGYFGKEKFNEGNEWRVDLKERLESVSIGKVKCCNPNDHFNFLDDSGYVSEREIMEYELYKIHHSHLIIVNFNEPKSIGSACEMTTAYNRRIPIIGLCETVKEKELHPWLRCMCNRIFTDREELTLYVIKHYINDD